MSARVKVQKSDPPESKVILAEAIVKIADGLKRLGDSGLNRKAIITLIQHETKMSRGDISRVLNAQQQLAGWYCK